MREARAAVHLTQEDLGGRVGKTPFQISNYERGRHEPRPSTVAAIARETGKPLEFFYDEDDEDAALDAALMRAIREMFRQEVARAIRDRVPVG